MAGKKQSKVTGLRLTTKARAKLEEITEAGEYSQGDFVSALLELADLNHDQTLQQIKEIRGRRKIYTDRANKALALKSQSWTEYTETWRVDDEETVLHWTRGELEQIADRFITHDYWLERFRHFVACDKPDRLRLTREFTATACGLCLPLRWRLLKLMISILHAEFRTDFDGDDFEVDDDLVELVDEIFEVLPFPSSNEFRGIKIGLMDQIDGTGARLSMGTATDLFSTDDWARLLEALDIGHTKAKDAAAARGEPDALTPFTLDEIKPTHTMTQGCRAWQNYPKEERDKRSAKLIKWLVEYFGVSSAKNCVPLLHAEIFGEHDTVHDTAGKRFTLKDGPFPRSKPLVRMAAALLVAREMDVVITVGDLYGIAGCAKSQVSQLLKEWPMFFERHSDENGPKRGGWIRLSSVGHEYFTADRCVKEGEIESGFLGSWIKVKDSERIDVLAQLVAGDPKGKGIKVISEKEQWSNFCHRVFGL